jgi:hypothetical protein
MLRNPLYILKALIDKEASIAYYAKKITRSEELIDAVLNGVEPNISDSLVKQLKRAAVAAILGNRFEELIAAGVQLDFFHDLDFQITFGHGEKAYQKTLGDLDYAHGLKARKRKVANITRANQALAAFDDAWRHIGPLLKAHPDWVWRDAVTHLEATGGIPEA